MTGVETGVLVHKRAIPLRQSTEASKEANAVFWNRYSRCKVKFMDMILFAPSSSYDQTGHTQERNANNDQEDPSK